MITAELFSDSAAEVQAVDLHYLVRFEEAWLKEARPDTLNNYFTEVSAVEAVRRVIQSRSLNGYVLRRDAKAIGIGTIVSDLVIKHPSPGPLGPWKLSGDQIDYWTEEMSLEDHRMTALTLAEATRTPVVLGILSRVEEERAQGIVNIMQKVGLPGRIGIPMGRRGYGLSQVEVPLQVYRYGWISS
jgi:hypothetical protein